MQLLHGSDVVEILVCQLDDIKLKKIQLLFLDKVQHQIQWSVKLINSYLKAHSKNLSEIIA